MRPPLSRVLVALLAGVLAVSGCGGDDPVADRAPGDPITAEEAEALAGVLEANFDAGGADVVVVAPFAEDTTLTMNGSIDFADRTGTLDAVTEFGDGRPDEIRTLYFTADDVITGNIPGLTDAIAEAGRSDVLYLRRDLDQASVLVDNLLGMLTRLSTETADDPEVLLASGYTWAGNTTIDGVLSSTFNTGTATVSIGAEDQLMRQYASAPGDSDFRVTITLSDHGPREIDFPPEEQIANASDYPEVAEQVGS